jgi:NADH dehydrogenase FAD-containing subunit
MTDLPSTSRRSALQTLGAAVLAPVLISACAHSPAIVGSPSALMAKGTRRRVVVLGGGWGGLTTARHLRETAPELEVVVLERNPIFWSCPLSNKWLIDVVDTEFLMHSYAEPARKYGYTFVQTEVIHIERDKKRVLTAKGYVDYDWLVVSAGIKVT